MYDGFDAFPLISYLHDPPHAQMHVHWVFTARPETCSPNLEPVFFVRKRENVEGVDHFSESLRAVLRSYKDDEIRLGHVRCRCH